MKRWKCSVCGYEHEGENPPEKCPLCGVPAEKFVEIKDEEEAQSAGEPLVEAKEGLSWKCSVCGYKHEGHGLPEKCPLCGVASDKFQKIEADDLPTEQETNGGATCWKCSVCGYEHKGEVPPEKCPLCGVPSEKFVKQESGVVEPEDTATATVAEPAETVQTEKKTFLGFIRKQMLKHHVHPISVHFPNGVLPASLLFLALSIWLAVKGLELAAFFNLAFVLVNMPVVMVSGYLEWQSRYRGATTLLFKTKIASSLVVITCLTWLVGWRIINPNIIVDESPARWVYLGIAALMVGAAGVAGHLGGKLVFGSRS